MIYSKIANKDYKRPKRRKEKQEYERGDSVFVWNYDRIRLATITEVQKVYVKVKYDYGQGFSSPATFLYKYHIIGKTSPNNKLYKLVNV